MVGDAVLVRQILGEPVVGPGGALRRAAPLCCWRSTVRAGRTRAPRRSGRSRRPVCRPPLPRRSGTRATSCSPRPEGSSRRLSRRFLSAPRRPAPGPVSPKRKSPPKPSWEPDCSRMATMLVTKKLNFSVVPPPVVAVVVPPPVVAVVVLPPVVAPPPVVAVVLPPVAPVVLPPVAPGRRRSSTTCLSLRRSKRRCPRRSSRAHAGAAPG